MLKKNSSHDDVMNRSASCMYYTEMINEAGSAEALLAIHKRMWMNDLKTPLLSPSKDGVFVTGDILTMSLGEIMIPCPGMAHRKPMKEMLLTDEKDEALCFYSNLLKKGIMIIYDNGIDRDRVIEALYDDIPMDHDIKSFKICNDKLNSDEFTVISFLTEEGWRYNLLCINHTVTGRELLLAPVGWYKGKSLYPTDKNYFSKEWKDLWTGDIYRLKLRFNPFVKGWKTAKFIMIRKGNEKEA